MDNELRMWIRELVVILLDQGINENAIDKLLEIVHANDLRAVEAVLTLDGNWYRSSGPITWPPIEEKIDAHTVVENIKALLRPFPYAKVSRIYSQLDLIHWH